jgi:hypothetical protein
VDTDICTISGLTNRAVSDLAGDVITSDLGSIFRWVNERLANHTHGQDDSNKFAIVNLLEDKDNVRELSVLRSTDLRDPQGITYMRRLRPWCDT